MTTPQSVVVCVSRPYPVPAERVFDAWLDPELLGKWMFGPGVRDEEILRLTVDAEVGGRFSFLVRRQGQEIDHVGTYREIDRPRRLVFTWGGVGSSEEESVVTLEIVGTDPGCELTLSHEIPPKWADYASRTEAGWTSMLNAIGEMFESEV